MLIRTATVSDVPLIEACARAAYAPYVHRIGREPAPMVADFMALVHDGHVSIGIAEGSVVGYVVFYARDDHMHLENVAVLPDYQGRGFGVQLIAFAEAAARRAGLAAVELYTNEKMVENLSLYPKLGYVEIGRRTEAGFPRVFFRKTVG